MSNIFFKVGSCRGLQKIKYSLDRLLCKYVVFIFEISSMCMRDAVGGNLQSLIHVSLFLFPAQRNALAFRVLLSGPLFRAMI